MQRNVLMIVLLLALAPASAFAATITFDGGDPVASGEFTIAGDGPFAIDTFGSFATNAFGWCAQDCGLDGPGLPDFRAGEWPYGGGAAGKSSHPPQIVTLERMDGEPFTLNELEAAPLFNADDDNPLVVTGFLAGGGTVTQNLSLSDTPYELQPYVLSGFNNVLRVEFTKLDTAPDLQDAAIDNIVVDEQPAVVGPIPALDVFGMLLLVAAVMGGAFLGRRALG